MSDITFSINLQTRTFISPDGGPADTPAVTLGDRLLAAVDIYEATQLGNVQVHPNVRALRASVGEPLAPPKAGTFKLRLIVEGSIIEPAQTTALTLASTADAVMTAINALAEATGDLAVTAVERVADGIWLIRFTGDGEVGLEVADNQLTPTSFVRVRAFESSDRWVHELRLLQAPLAFAGDFERVLPEAPSVTRIRGGASGPEGSGLNVNEIQAVKIPRKFEGTFYLTHKFRATRVLGVNDGPEVMAEALNQLYDDGKVRFTVSNPESEQAYVEFTGPFENSPQELMAVTVHSFAAGEITFLLDLNREEMHAALRLLPQIEVPIELELEIIDEDADPDDPETVVRYISVRQNLQIQREVAWEELRTVPAIDWLKPPQPVRYVPFHPDQVITGNQHYLTSFGDGVASEFLVQHNLGTKSFHVTVVQNISGGRVLTQGAEYEVRFPEEDDDDPDALLNAVLLTFPAVVGNNALFITITTAGPKSAFQAHGHSIAEIDLLEDRLLALEGRVTTIEDRLPFTTPGTGPVGGGSLELQLATFFDNFPGRFGEATNVEKRLFPLRPAALLPAVHDAAVEEIPEVLPALADAKGRVFKNVGTVARVVPGGMGHKSAVIEVNEFCTCDGRLWYKVTQQGTSNSYHPTNFERVFVLEPINEKMLVPGSILTVTWKLGLQMSKMNTQAQYLMTADVGNVTAATTPSPVGINLKDVVWSATPILHRQILMSEQVVGGEFGISIKRDILNNLTANQMMYKRWEDAAGAPTSPNFVLRIQLRDFDTKDPVEDARGAIFVSFTEPHGTIAS